MAAHDSEDAVEGTEGSTAWNNGSGVADLGVGIADQAAGTVDVDEDKMTTWPQSVCQHYGLVSPSPANFNHRFTNSLSSAATGSDRPRSQSHKRIWLTTATTTTVLQPLYTVVKLLCKRWWFPTDARLERPKLEPEGPRADGVTDRRPGVFEHSRHFVWLLWHLNSVWRLQHLSMHTKHGQMHTTKWPWRTTFYKTSCIEKTNQCKLCSGGSQEKGAGSQ